MPGRHAAGMHPSFNVPARSVPANLVLVEQCSNAATPCRGRLLAAHPDGGAQLNSVDEILDGISNKGALLIMLTT